VARCRLGLPGRTGALAGALVKLSSGVEERPALASIVVVLDIARGCRRCPSPASGDPLQFLQARMGVPGQERL
jgi:hypothetical protein